MTVSPPSILSRLHAGLIAAAFLFVIILFAPVSHAGGLGFAPLAAIAGIAGYVGAGNTIRPSGVSIVFWALMGLLIWGGISSIWSPYESRHMISNPAKLLIAMVLYSGVFLLPMTLRFKPRFIRRAIIMAGWLTMGLLLFDQLTGYSITDLVDPINANENPIHRDNTIYMNLSHSITVLAILTPLMIALFRTEFKRWKWVSAIWIVGVLGVSAIGQIFVGGIALFVGLFFCFLAVRNAQMALFAVISFAIFTILLAPILGHTMNYVTPEMKASMAGSWEHRVEMWGYVAEKIAEKPILGHGFDASRTFDDTFHFRGHDNWTIVSLHPHNAGLHIWTELGAVGAALASLFLYGVGQVLRPYVAVSSSRALATTGFLAAALMVCTFTYGIWQEWWWGILFLISGLITLSFSQVAADAPH